MNYFVTVNGFKVATGLTLEKAISIAKTKYDHSNQVGIGRTKRINGQVFYTCFPLHFYI